MNERDETKILGRRYFNTLDQIMEVLERHGGNLSDVKTMICGKYPHCEVKVAKRRHGEIFLRPYPAPRGKWISRDARRRIWLDIGRELPKFLFDPAWDLVHCFKPKRVETWLAEWKQSLDVVVSPLGVLAVHEPDETGKDQIRWLLDTEKEEFIDWVTWEKFTDRDRSDWEKWFRDHPERQKYGYRGGV